MGFFLFGMLGIPEPQETIRIKSHVFLCLEVKEKEITYRHLGLRQINQKIIVIKLEVVPDTNQGIKR